MTHYKIIPFDRPVSAAVLPGRSGRVYTESEVAAIRTQAYQEGADSARAFSSQQLVEFRAEVQSLQEGLFQKLAAADGELLSQLRETLPGLAVELARRLLAGFEPTAEQVQRICEETLAQLYPERDNLELFICPSDAALLDQVSSDWKTRYPNLKVVVDPTLGPGDCQVRSRFGLTDARRQAKLEALSRELLSA
jgi:flagellar assembly protein FliH